MVVCMDTGQLFVGDWNCVWQTAAEAIDIDKRTVKRISTECRPWTLSIASGRLVVTTYDVNWLFVYNTSIGDDKSMPSSYVQLPDNMYPHHAAETKDGNYVVCHVGYWTVDNDGKRRYVQVDISWNSKLI